MAAITITNAGLNLIRDGVSGAANPLVTYVALGAGSTAPAVTDTKLVSETFRKKITSYTNGGANGEILISMYLAPNDDIGDSIAEIGFIIGGSASPNSGTLLARGLYSHTKLATESIQIQLDLTI